MCMRDLDGLWWRASYLCSRLIVPGWGGGTEGVGELGAVEWVACGVRLRLGD
jgi:hypothetical protein